MMYSSARRGNSRKPSFQKPSKSGIAAGQIDQANVRIGAPLAVVIVAFARMQQAIGDAGARNGLAERIGQHFHAGRPECQWRLGNADRRAIAEPKAATRQADLTERR